MTTWDINAIRFGFAGYFLLVLLLLCNICERALCVNRKRQQRCGAADAGSQRRFLRLASHRVSGRGKKNAIECPGRQQFRDVHVSNDSSVQQGDQHSTSVCPALAADLPVSSLALQREGAEREKTDREEGEIFRDAPHGDAVEATASDGEALKSSLHLQPSRSVALLVGPIALQTDSPTAKTPPVPAKPVRKEEREETAVPQVSRTFHDLEGAVLISADGACKEEMASVHLSKGEGDDNRGHEGKEKKSEERSNQRWYRLPCDGSMSRSQWIQICCGVLLVTFLSPALSQYALFQISVGITLTLTSTGPLWSLPLVWLMKRERVVSSDIRQECFAEQRQGVPLKWAAYCLVSGSYIFSAYYFELMSAFASLVWFAWLLLMAFSATPLVTGEGRCKGQQSNQKERNCFLGLLASLFLFHVGAVSVGTPSRDLDLVLMGVAAVWNKMTFVVFFLAPMHFNLLNLADSVLWLAALTYSIRPTPTMFIAIALPGVCLFVMAFGVSKVSEQTLNKILDERDKREQAEEAQRAFLSYIMHEMRNPLSGALLLTSEFSETLRELLNEGGDGEGLIAPLVAAASPAPAASCAIGEAGGGGSMAVAEATSKMTEADPPPVQDQERLSSSGQKGTLNDSERFGKGGERSEAGEEGKAQREEGCDCRTPELLEGSLSLSVQDHGRTGNSQVQRAKMMQLAELVSMMSCQLEKMQTVCNDVLQLSKLESGKFEYRFQAGDLFSWLRHVALVSGRTFFAEQEEFKSFWETDPSIAALIGDGSASEGISPAGSPSSGPMRAVADFPRLSQVIDNFLSNARKFSKGGEVALTANIRALSADERRSLTHLIRGEVEGDGVMVDQWTTTVRELYEKEKDTMERGGSSTSLRGLKGLEWAMLRVSVKDSGVGLAPEDIPKLFKPYSQIRAGVLQNGGGTGLGLSICKNFVEAHGKGRIWAESGGVGMGSQFVFEVCLPLVPRSPPTRRHSGASSQQSVFSRWQTIQLSSRENSLALTPEMQKGIAMMQQGLSLMALSEGEAAEAGVEVPRDEKERREKDSTRENEQTSTGAAAAAELPVEEIKRDRTAEEGTGEINQITECPSEDLKEQPQPRSPPEIIHSVSPTIDSPLNQKDPPRSTESPKLCGDFETPSSKLRSSILLNKTTVLPKPGHSVKDSVRSSPQSVDVLLVDDDRFCLLAASAVIRRLGLSVETAESGEEAVQRVTASTRHILERGDPQDCTEFPSFKLIIFDNNMPGLSGPQAAQKIRAHFRAFQNTAQKPEGESGNSGCLSPPCMVGCTGDVSEETRAAFFEAGALKVLHKPIRKETLEEALKGLPMSFHAADALC
uniref:histidine kinase n=1 Tax=Chromera velia CCMP2878 TaxID=1169474 RepID=A0A0G4I1I1_9ALVE|eukprot:Cvel_10115.t1-p1 / transcript=Cvel_10115.t1 / gene=Cvel_10115 / organism=Chromera_velia_CCMP2878 / gene_product=Ethylene receptor, putative / transcript_product=Ethylene receptor, putative / location=Cvel_scaffold603:2606-10935(-) / protein_length=1328 / sequence_SO=supercontig / SO=protein_coding / is_pseudo=false